MYLFIKLTIDKLKNPYYVCRSDFFKFESLAHKNEHSLEVQVPFIQVINNNMKIVTILVNNLDIKVRHTKFKCNYRERSYTSWNGLKYHKVNSSCALLN